MVSMKAFSIMDINGYTSINLLYFLITYLSPISFLWQKQMCDLGQKYMVATQEKVYAFDRCSQPIHLKVWLEDNN